MEKAKELFNHVPSDESISLTAWFNLALSVLTAALSIWHTINALITFSSKFDILSVNRDKIVNIKFCSWIFDSQRDFAGRSASLYLLQQEIHRWNQRGKVIC